MRKIQIFLIITALTGFLNCNSIKTVDEKTDLVLNHYHRNEIRESDSVSLTKKHRKDTLYYTYRKNNDTLIYSFKKLRICDSIIIIDGINCPLIRTKKIIINENEFFIKKYCYDVENSIDEESSFYYNENYGLLVGFNDGWADLMFSMKYDQISEILIDSIINDRTGFYTTEIEIPVLTNDSLIFEIIKEI